ncbi:hypothetical protein F441_20060 [Phytophthora nicotianae CJ01A1]|uniref:Uncharacterized protein n=2 Tax=Phytophthora nicotianae TaxID=4792 RepID=W2VYX4_PHYNI|nr:hypothetical protein F444_20196 [Phytophthora nicotianae P1976]ETP02928.1 hypothetical protein F441_20060 [Phytophthora nicotianae CJ01A1]
MEYCNRGQSSGRQAANFEMLVFLRANWELWDFTSVLGFHEAADQDAE